MEYKVSVVIPVYGAEKYIERCARSLFEQSLKEIEFIFVNDCTQDKSIEILEKVIKDYAEREKNIKILNLSKNEGSAVARRIGLGNCHGEYIIQCDSDDWIDKDAYNEMYSLAKKNDADVVICDYFITDGKNKKVFPLTHPTERLEWIKEMLYQRTSWSLCNKLFRSSLYKNKITYPKYSMGEDSAIVMQLAYSCHKIVYTSRPLYYYYTNPNSIVNTRQEEKRYRKFCEAMDNNHIIEEFYRGKKEMPSLVKGFNYTYYNTKNLLLLPLTNSPKYKDIYKRTYQGIEKKVLLDKNVSSINRIKSLLIILGIYPKLTNAIGLTKCK